MKSKIKASSAAMAALLGISQVAIASDGSSFTPVEDLAPEQRQQVYEQLVRAADHTALIDWDRVVVGINEVGEITFMTRTEVGLQAMASPSSFSALSKAVTE